MRRDGQDPEPEDISARRATIPETLRRQLSGDLDNIVRMALAKDPARRYGSVRELVEDISRHLDGCPVALRDLVERKARVRGTVPDAALQCPLWCDLETLLA